MVNEREVCEEWARDLVRAVERGLDLSKRNRVKAYRLFLKFLEEEYGVDASGLLARLKIPPSRPDRRVPSDGEILDSLRRAPEKARLYLLLLVSTGLRSVEVRCLLSERRGVRYEGEIAYVPLELERKTKKSFAAFMPSPVGRLYESAAPLEVPKYYYGTVAKRRGLVGAKYVRKWVSQKMVDLGLEIDAIDFIQGRSPRSHVVLFTSYASLFNRAKEQYRIYARWLVDFLERGEVELE